MYNSRHSSIRYTLIPYSRRSNIRGYEHFIHGNIEFTPDRGWVIFDEKKNSGIFIRPILESLSKDADDFMKPHIWLIVKGEPSSVQNIIGEMLMDDAYMIEAYDIWKIKLDAKSYNIALATDVNCS